MCLVRRSKQLQEFQARQTGWTTEKEQLRHDLEVMSPYFGYIRFAAHPRDYIVHLVGQSFQYEVPVNKRGHLARFRGIRVRVACVRSGIRDRVVMVGPANPLDLLQVNEPTRRL